MSFDTQDLLISVDSHVHFTDEWVKERLPKTLWERWDSANVKIREHNEKELRRGAPQLSMEDFVDMEAAQDPGHFEPHAKLRAMDLDGVYAEVIFPEVGALRICTPDLVGDDWKLIIQAYKESMADFASVDTKRLMTAYQIPLFDIDFAVDEVERLKKRGARCVQITSFPSELKLLPSEYFKRQMGATFMHEPRGLKIAYDYFGPDCLYWSTDFPHPATCWPHSRERVKEQFAQAGIAEADKRKIVFENGMRTFGLGA